MQTSEKGLQLIQTEEGFSAYPYQDIAGIWTIGFGHRMLPGESYPNGITREEGVQILMRDVAVAEAGIERLVKVALTQSQFDALVDFTFNLGVGSLAESTLLRLLNAGKYDAVPAQLLEWCHSGATVVPGLLARRQAETAMWKE